MQKCTSPVTVCPLPRWDSGCPRMGTVPVCAQDIQCREDQLYKYDEAIDTDEPEGRILGCADKVCDVKEDVQETIDKHSKSPAQCKAGFFYVIGILIGPFAGGQ